jgi:hypothetical protein
LLAAWRPLSVDDEPSMLTVIARILSCAFEPVCVPTAERTS